MSDEIHTPDGGAAAPGPDMSAAVPTNDLADAAVRPDYLPEKFWDADAGEARTEALARSYAELERKLGGEAQGGVPADPDGYRIEIEGQAIAADPDVNRALHAAGFTQGQAQLVYRLAAEQLMPMVSEIAQRYEAESQIARLAQHFGGEGRWRETARQIAAWGKARFAPEVFAALAATYEGVVAMHRMMAGGEPNLTRDGAAVGALSEGALRELMRDPRYWREREPATVERVREGFRRLYPD